MVDDPPLSVESSSSDESREHDDPRRNIGQIAKSHPRMCRLVGSQRALQARLAAAPYQLRTTSSGHQSDRSSRSLESASSNPASRRVMSRSVVKAPEKVDMWAEVRAYQPFNLPRPALTREKPQRTRLATEQALIRSMLELPSDPFNLPPKLHATRERKQHPNLAYKRKPGSGGKVSGSSSQGVIASDFLLSLILRRKIQVRLQTMRKRWKAPELFFRDHWCAALMMNVGGY